MSAISDLSPNEPDVVPDYVDDFPGSPEMGKTVAARKTVQTERSQAAPPPKNVLKIKAAEDRPVAPEPTPRISVVTDHAAPAADKSPAVADAAAAVKTASPTATAAAFAPTSSPASYREHECIPNVPDVRPDFLSEAEAEAVVGARQPTEIRPDLKPDDTPVWLHWRQLALVLLGGCFGVLLLSQAISAFALAATLPFWARYLLLIPLAGCCLAVVFVGIRLAQAWLRLRAIHQVDLQSLEELRIRAETRQDGIEHLQRARNSLESYLKHYPMSSASALRAAGLATPGIEKLAAGRERLIGRSIDSRSWIEDYRASFQTHLDAAAMSRVNAWSLKAAGCVIASPLPLLDAALILGISLKMLKDLCVLYNVRTSKSGSLLLLNRAITAAFIAGVAADGVEIAGGWAGEELAGTLGESTLNSLGARVAGVVAPKLGEGAINAFFIRRLGKAAIGLLQPLRAK